MYSRKLHIGEFLEVNKLHAHMLLGLFCAVHQPRPTSRAIGHSFPRTKPSLATIDMINIDKHKGSGKAKRWRGAKDEEDGDHEEEESASRLYNSCLGHQHL